MTFANAEVLYFLALIPLLVIIFIAAERKRKVQLGAMVDEQRRAMVMGAGFERRLVYLVLLCIGVGLLVAAAARPQWGTKLESLHSRGFDILIAVDVSESMRANDVAPDRISKARQEVEKFLGLLKGDRVGLIAFAGSSYAFCPLTNDYAAIRLFLSGLEPGVIEDAGTDIGAAINEAVATFERSESTAHKVLVIFSDGEHHEENPLPAVNRAVTHEVQIFTVGIGNADTSGERIPIYAKGSDEVDYKKDQQGNLIVSRLDETTLQAVAEAGNGSYHRVSEAGTELVTIYRSLAENEETEFNSRQHRRMEDRYQIPLLISFLTLVLAYSLGNRSFKKLRRTQGVKS